MEGVEEAVLLWIKRGLWTLLLPVLPFSEVTSHHRKGWFFSLKKELCNLLPYIQNDFLMFEVLGARIVGRITQWVLQHSPIPRNYRLIWQLVIGKGGFCSKVIFIANFPVQLMREKHNPKFPGDTIKLCWWHILFFKKDFCSMAIAGTIINVNKSWMVLLQESNSSLQPVMWFTPSAFWLHGLTTASHNVHEETSRQ